MRAIWAIAGGVALGTAVAWWFSRDTPEQARAKRERAEQAAAAEAEDARPVLYRWRDGEGVLHITEEPPGGKDAGRKYQRIDREPRPGVEVKEPRHPD